MRHRLAEMDLDTPVVPPTITTRGLVEITFRQDENGAVCIATVEVPEENGGFRLQSFRGRALDVLTAAQATGLIGKVWSTIVVPGLAT